MTIEPVNYEKYIYLISLIILEFFSIIFTKKPYTSHLIGGLIESIKHIFEELNKKSGSSENVFWDRLCAFFVIAVLLGGILLVIPVIPDFEAQDKVALTFISICFLYITAFLTLLLIQYNKKYISQ